MNKQKSFLYGFAIGFLGIIVAVLLYFLYFKKRRVNVAYYWLGVFAIFITLLSIFGASALIGILNYFVGGTP